MSPSTQKTEQVKIISNEGLTPEEAKKQGRKLIGIDGNWYDVTNYIPFHPGGDILEHFIGKDASTVFHSYNHPTSVFKYRKPVGTYKMEPKSQATIEFENLIKKFHERGYFKTDVGFYINKVIVALFFIAVAFSLVRYTTNWYAHMFGALFLALFQQQCGFLMHDVMHGNMVRNIKLDRFFGVIFGTIGLGVSSHWWKYEHFLHHGLTNLINLETNFNDPQMVEDIWAQHPNLFPLFRKRIHNFLIKTQHITFLPVVMIFGRIGILVDSFREERRWYEWLGWGIHWAYMGLIIFSLPTRGEMINFVTLNFFFEGVLHLQLVFSHYAKPFDYQETFNKQNWYVYQVSHTINISTPWWQDWFYGGLNYHIEHHLFPKLGRNYLRQASHDVQEVCKKLGIEYESLTFWETLVKTLQTFKTSSKLYDLDPR